MAVQPVVKWVGGKRQLLPEIVARVPKAFDPGTSTYYESFLGGAAVLFGLSPQKAVVNDSNEGLINVYQVVRDEVDELIALLSTYQNSPEFYREIRALDRDAEIFASLSDVEKAARFIYLNKTCFNGLYRVNKKGHFNASFGKYVNPKICDEGTLRDVSKYLNTAEIDFRVGDFEQCVEGAVEGDFVYFDPPYIPLSATSSFTRYTADGFDFEDQLRLRHVVEDLTQRGVFVMVSNSSSPLVANLYTDYRVEIVQANRRVNTKGTDRGKIDEFIVTNYTL